MQKKLNLNILIVLITLVSGVVLVFFAITPALAAPACHQLDSSTNVPTNYGASYDTLNNTKPLLIQAFCSDIDVDIEIGDGLTSRYVYKYGYIYKNNNWQQINFTPTGRTEGSWYIGKAKAKVTMNANEFDQESMIAAFVCTWSNNTWKCGCRDSNCYNMHWQVQKFKRTSNNCPDIDQDGYTICAGDCDDSEYWANPGNNNETCDTIDNNCNNQTDEGCDDDNDGYCDQNKTIYRSNSMCSLNAPGDYVNGYAGDDCNDNNASIKPGVSEVCGNNQDDNCNNQTDEGCTLTGPTCGQNGCESALGESCSSCPGDCGDCVDLPSCENNPDAVIIDSDEDFMHINDPGKSVFCIKPGTYDYGLSGVDPDLKLTQPGTKDKPRYLIYYNPNASDTHPWKQTLEEQAVIKQAYVQAPYWVIDGLTFRWYDSYLRGLIYYQNSNIHVNNVLVEGSNLGVYITGGSYNILENSVIRNTVKFPRDDSNCINTARAKYTIIRNNEIYNCTDGIQVWEREGDIRYSAEGTTIENNEFYITPAMYADCTNTHPTESINPSGGCACSENAIDLKVGTWLEGDEIRPEDYVRIRNNVMYGYRNSRGWCGASGGPGSAITLHHPETDYVLIENNIIFNAQRGVGPGGGGDHITIRNNIFYNISDFDGDYEYQFDSDNDGILETYKDNESIALNLGYGRNIEVYHNTVIGGIDPEFNIRMDGEYDATYDIRNNLFINAGTINPSVSNDWNRQYHFGYNAFFNSEVASDILDPSTNVVASDPKMEAHCFTIKKHTNPQQFCIPNAKPTANSPFINKGDSAVGTLLAHGVDDKIRNGDLTGAQRDSQPDMGAFEYGGSTPIDNTPPTITAFSISPGPAPVTINDGQEITALYTVTNFPANSQIQLYRTRKIIGTCDTGAESSCAWTNVKDDTLSSGSGSLKYTPPVGTWLFGLHVEYGNGQWVDEGSQGRKEVTVNLSGELPIFPGAEGFGTDWTISDWPDSTPDIYYVNSLNPSAGRTIRSSRADWTEYEAGLKTAMEATGARVIVFEISGEIKVNSYINIKDEDAYCYIAGETAPEPGITVTGGTLSLSASNVFLHHLRWRTGDRPVGVTGNNRDGIRIKPGGVWESDMENIVIDHCSLSWGIDGTLDVADFEQDGTALAVDNVTISNTILAETLHESLHTTRGDHSLTGFISGLGHVSYIRNFYTNSFSRNPQLGAERNNLGYVAINNLWYNCYDNMATGGNIPNQLHLNLQGNVVLDGGPASTGANSDYAFLLQSGSVGSKVYLGEGEYRNDCPKYPSDNDCVRENSGTPSNWRASMPTISFSPMTVLPYHQTKSHVLSNVGAYPMFRDSTDLRVTANAESQSGGSIKDCVDPSGTHEIPGNETWDANIGPGSTVSSLVISDDASKDHLCYSRGTACDDWYNDMMITIKSGACSGVTRKILDYTGQTLTVKVDPLNSNPPSGNGSGSCSGIPSVGDDYTIIFECSKGSYVPGGWSSISSNTNQRALTPPVNPYNDDDSDGYTNLEEWLHCHSCQVEGPQSPNCVSCGTY